MYGRAGQKLELKLGFLLTTEAAEKSNPLSEEFSEMGVESMAFWLPRFMLDVRKEKGENYPTSSVYSLCCGLQREYA
jgi:hypothetical protein